MTGNLHGLGARVKVTQENGRETGMTQAPFAIPTGFYTLKGVIHKEETIGDDERRGIDGGVERTNPPALPPRPGVEPAFPREGATQVFDSERSVIWDVTVLPGAGRPLYHDKDSVDVFLNGGAVKTTGADGKSLTIARKPNEVRFSPRGRIDTDEAIEAPVRMVVIEPNSSLVPSPSPQPPPPAPSPSPFFGQQHACELVKPSPRAPSVTIWASSLSDGSAFRPRRRHRTSRGRRDRFPRRPRQRCLQRGCRDRSTPAPGRSPGDAGRQRHYVALVEIEVNSRPSSRITDSTECSKGSTVATTVRPTVIGTCRFLSASRRAGSGRDASSR